jgi:molybdenum cofactor biosynthesis enzyme
MCARHMEDRLPIALPVVTHYKNLHQPCERAVAFRYRGGVLVEALDTLNEAVLTVLGLCKRSDTVCSLPSLSICLPKYTTNFKPFKAQ